MISQIPEAIVHEELCRAEEEIGADIASKCIPIILVIKSANFKWREYAVHDLPIPSMVSLPVRCSLDPTASRTTHWVDTPAER